MSDERADKERTSGEGISELTLAQLQPDVPQPLPEGGYVTLTLLTDPFGLQLHQLTVSGGRLVITVILERGMDIGEIRLDGEKISWERDERYLLHPEQVDLADNEHSGWDSGFYAAVAAIGPEIFGTPDELRTVHGTGSYSPALPESVRLSWDDRQICLEGNVPVRGYGPQPVYDKIIRIVTRPGAATLLREDTVRNLTDSAQPVDDGYHIQLAGPFMSEGGSYVLPVLPETMLLRDSAPPEADPLAVYDTGTKLDPIRCYQYVPERVEGLADLPQVRDYHVAIGGEHELTAEMLVNTGQDAAAYVIRSLQDYPRSLIAKRAITDRMYALEPCKTRPNSLKQKTIDGETVYLAPHGQSTGWIIIGASRDPQEIAALTQMIRSAAK
ncbi:DUF4432 family protein [Paenibacillus sp. MMS20-IR301]|uniref:DUF4432 family protein n=1 Tax=Paenibacillus sp. MMS20-IR301 TaxID=2895946 RepID=UPI0028E35241|nr:DUF4432 family protein [Paenibacillus sp. MMS20-IR301]WNS44049.1 DUF4432 family protein [Paenibacillus sp. MMS20-IR301]